MLNCKNTGPEYGKFDSEFSLNRKVKHKARCLQLTSFHYSAREIDVYI